MRPRHDIDLESARPPNVLRISNTAFGFEVQSFHRHAVRGPMHRFILWCGAITAVFHPGQFNLLKAFKQS